MNTYKKFAPNVFVAKCEEKQTKGGTITMTTKRGKEHECIVFNLVGRGSDGSWYYSIVRADGFNAQERAKRKAEKYQSYSDNAEKRSNDHWESSHEGRDFLALAEPIKVGHHSEKRHRALIERNHRRMDKSIQESEKANDYKERSEYWESRTNDINLSMPESLEYYEYKLEEAKERHEGLKSGKYKRDHSYSLTYAKKAVNDLTNKFEIAKKLWE